MSTVQLWLLNLRLKVRTHMYSSEVGSKVRLSGPNGLNIHKSAWMPVKMWQKVA